MSDFLSELLNTVEVRADVENDLTASAFVAEMADRMAAAEEIENLVPIHFRGQSGRRNGGVDGHDIGDSDDSVALAIAHFDGSGTGGTIGNTEVQGPFGLLEAYLGDTVAGTFPVDREPSEPAVQLARDIHSRGRSVTRFRLYLNRPGMSGDSDCWEGWSHARRYEEAVPGRVEGAGGADGRRGPG